MATIKQQIAVNRLLENHGNIGKAMREAGYADNTAKNPMNLTQSDGYKEIAEPIVKQMEKERQRAIKALSLKNLDEVSYEKISDVIDKLTKNIQLLSGGETERVSVVSGFNYLTPNESDNTDNQTITKTASGLGKTTGQDD